MLSKINYPSATLSQCWFLRRHVPVGRRRRLEDGTMQCTCRYCQRPIRSLEGQHWELADGFDLDALAQAAPTSHFAVVDRIDEMVVARYPIAADADEQAIAAQLEQIREKHVISPDDDSIEVRLVLTKSQTPPLH